MGERMKILLLAPYCGGSHRTWAEGYVAHSNHDVTLLSLAARFWKWRMQGGAVTLADQTRAVDHRPDLILATDMLNLPAFLGLTRDILADIPAALYCHENQLTYPMPPGETRDLTYGMINWLSMLAADRVFFNSQYHLDDWSEALPNMLKHFPDHSHLHRVDGVRAKTSVLPVGCDLKRLDGLCPSGASHQPPLILWNQRWEYDKDPETFFRALYALDQAGVGFRVAIAGRSYRQTAPEFEAARERLGDRVIHFGHAEPDVYARLLNRADVVVSTAIHEFFGVAVVEAIYAGCFPLLPGRLSYPELIPESHHDPCLYHTFEDLLASLRWALTHPRRARSLAEELRPSVAQFDWSRMAPLYDRELGAIA
jgi:glycosyltransferase involved in cell wall biosynthesis